MFPGKIDTMIKMIEFLNVPFVKIDKRLCTNLRLKDSCSKCKDICPVDALDIDTDILIDEKKCVKCGACATSCGNGVFRMLDISVEGIVSKVFEMSSSYDRIQFECNGCDNLFRIKHKKVPKDVGKISLPCLGRINEIILLSVHYLDFKEVKFTDCNDKCPFKPARIGLDKSQQLTNHMINSINLTTSGKNTINQIKFLRSSDEDLIHERRDFLFESGKRAARIAMNRKETDKEIKGFQEPRINIRRETFLSFIKNHEVIDYIVERKNLPFADIEVNKSCNLCGICCRICPTGSIWLVDDKSTSYLKFDFSRCVGCDSCEKICVKSSIHIKNEVNFSYLLREPVALHLMTLTECSKCKTGFVSVLEEDKCHNCSRTEDLTSNFTKGRAR